MGHQPQDWSAARDLTAQYNDFRACHEADADQVTHDHSLATERKGMP